MPLTLHSDALRISPSAAWCKAPGRPARHPVSAPSLPRRGDPKRVSQHAARGALAPAAAAAEASTSGRCLPEDFSLQSRDGRWRVRPVNRTDLLEVRRVVALQTEGFHVPNPIPFLDSTFKTFFQAEVLSEMQKKLRYNPADRFVCLVVEGVQGEGVVGVVEVALLGEKEKEIMQSLEPDTAAFAYVASMAVAPAVRRRGAASALLAATERVAALWGERQSLLHVYQDNAPAVQLYQANGYKTIFQDAPWLARLAVRPRFLMRKWLV